MLLNPISFIFKLGKHQSLKLQPLRKLSANSEVASLPLPPALMTPNVPDTKRQPEDSNQMSS